MSDMQKAFGTLGEKPTGPTYAHPQAEDIVRECSSLLMRIPEGRRLLKYAKDNDIQFTVVSGREVSSHRGGDRTVFLVCPVNTKAVDIDEIACVLGMGIREIEQPSVGIPWATPGVANLEQLTFNHILDIILEMCKIADEVESVKGKTKLVDLIKRLGHAEIHRGIREGKSAQELASILSKTIKTV